MNTDILKQFINDNKMTIDNKEYLVKRISNNSIELQGKKGARYNLVFCQNKKVIGLIDAIVFSIVTYYNSIDFCVYDNQIIML